MKTNISLFQYLNMSENERKNEQMINECNKPERQISLSALISRVITSFYHDLTPVHTFG